MHYAKNYNTVLPNTQRKKLYKASDLKIKQWI